MSWIGYSAGECLEELLALNASMPKGYRVPKGRYPEAQYRKEHGAIGTGIAHGMMFGMPDCKASWERHGKRLVALCCHGMHVEITLDKEE